MTESQDHLKGDAELRLGSVLAENDQLRAELNLSKALLAKHRDSEENVRELRQKLFEARYLTRWKAARGGRTDLILDDVQNAALSDGDERSLAVDQDTLLLRMKLAIDLVRNGFRKGIFVVTSAFEFQPEYNQRPIAIAKQAAMNGYMVIFVAWQWTQDEVLKKKGQIFAGSILQIGRFDLSSWLNLSSVQEDKYFCLTIPSDDFVSSIPAIQSQGYHVVYDILDDWEEFHKVGQATWWRSDLESSAVLTSDMVSAVSPALIQKFEPSRSNIVLVPNGLRKMESEQRFISLRAAQKSRKIVAGYFGHLTDAWFDWKQIFRLAEDNNWLEIRLIGYGAPVEALEEVKRRGNIKTLGFIPADKLADEVCNWHLGIIPFISSPLVAAVDPIKIYEYLYFGLPVLASGMPHLSSYPETVVVDGFAHAGPAIKTAYNRLIAGEIDYPAMTLFVETAGWESRFVRMIEQANA